MAEIGSGNTLTKMEEPDKQSELFAGIMWLGGVE